MIKRRTGLDRSIAFIVLGRVSTRTRCSIGTVTLDPCAFLTLARAGLLLRSLEPCGSLSMMFDLGFSFVILQIAAHERAHLDINPDGRIAGPEIPLRRLAAVLQRSVQLGISRPPY